MTNEQYYELIKPYEDASRVLSTRLEILNHSLYGDRSDAGPIHNIQGRIKEKKSMESKLVRLGFTAGVTNARNHLQDIAGLRIICYFVEDIYNLTAALKKTVGSGDNQGKGLYPQCQAQRIQELSHCAGYTGVFSGHHGIFSGGGAASDHGHGFLGQHGTPGML